MSEPVIIRVVRPYSTVEEFLNAEATTIDRRGMLLVDADEIPEDTLVRFIVSLESGEALIKAEGRVRAHVAGDTMDPGGLQVRFKRFGTATKEFIDRAVTHRVMTNRPPPPDSDVDSSRQPADITETELSTPDAGLPPLPPTSGPETGLAADTDDGEISGIRHQPAGNVPPPKNRDELLDRLRTRARNLTDEKLAAIAKRAQVG